jgi:magnesium transporter
MLKAFAWENGKLICLAPEDAARAAWFDLESGVPEEIAFVTRHTGQALPGHADLTEIETSSRLATDGPVMTMSMPIVTRSSEGLEAGVCGFVLTPDVLVTLRFTPSIVFRQFPSQPHAIAEPVSACIFASLLEAIVDRQADALEALRAELDHLSHKIFHHRMAGKARATELELQATLVTLGRSYDTISFLRDSQLGAARVAPYAATATDWMPKSVRHRLESVQKDVSSLNEYSTHLTDKVQFLLDSTLGLINIAQNTLIKVLTVVSIMGIPPTLIAGIYGMNFHIMPELSWTYGYAYAWAAMIFSALAPLYWFRKKGWI